MNRLDRLVWLSACAAVLIGLALAHAVQSCVIRTQAVVQYLELTPGSCVGRDLTWLKWAVGIGGFVVAAVVLSIGWMRRRVTNVSTPPVHSTADRRAFRVLLVLTAAVLVALLVPSVPLIRLPSAVYGTRIPVPMDNRIPLRLAILAAGAVGAAAVALRRSGKTAR